MHSSPQISGCTTTEIVETTTIHIYIYICTYTYTLYPIGIWKWRLNPGSPKVKHITNVILLTGILGWIASKKPARLFGPYQVPSNFFHQLPGNKVQLLSPCWAPFFRIDSPINFLLKKTNEAVEVGVLIAFFQDPSEVSNKYIKCVSFYCSSTRIPAKISHSVVFSLNLKVGDLEVWTEMKQFFHDEKNPPIPTIFWPCLGKIGGSNKIILFKWWI